MSEGTGPFEREQRSGVPLPGLRPDEGVTTSPEEASALDRSLVRGIAWTTSAKWITQILSWASTLIVARILTPEDYGLVGMAGVFLGLVLLLNEFGIGTSIVIQKRLDEKQIPQLNGLALLLGVVSLAIGIAGAGPLSGFFETAKLSPVVMVLSIGFLIASFRTVPMGLLQKELRFPRLAVIESVQAVLSSLPTLLLAFLGAGYWSLVFGNLIGSTVGSILTFGSRPVPVSRPTREIRPLVRISSHIIVARVAWRIYSSADFLIVGKWLGSAALGFYSLGWSLAGLPIEKITALVARVTPAVFSRTQDDPAGLRRYFCATTEGLAFVIVPLTWGIAFVADPFVRVVLGEKWTGSIAPLQILAVYASFRAITPILFQVLNVTGHTAFAMIVNLITAVILPAGFFFASRYGVVGVAATWIIIHPVIMLFVYVKTFRVMAMPVRMYLGALWPAASAGALMVAALFVLARALPDGIAAAWELVLSIAVGAAVYSLTLFLGHKDRLVAAREVVRMVRR